MREKFRRMLPVRAIRLRLENGRDLTINAMFSREDTLSLKWSRGKSWAKNIKRRRIYLLITLLITKKRMQMCLCCKYGYSDSVKLNVINLTYSRTTCK